MERIDGRKHDDLRTAKITRDYLKYSTGSVLIEMGNTKVICTATSEESVPSFLRGKGQGWVTAEYAMIPGCSQQRIRRERRQVGGRTQEIQRLIGRSLRAIVDMRKLGERTITIDCDVIQADGGTRTAAITGAYIALFDTLKHLHSSGAIEAIPLTDSIQAVSVGVCDGVPLLDLNYEEDSKAEVDMNVVMTGSGHFIELQGTAESKPFSMDEKDSMIELARKGLSELKSLQEDLTKG